MDDETLMITLYCLLDDWYKSRGQALVASRPGPKPACSDCEVLTIELARQIMGALPERRFLRWLRRNHPDWFPHLPEDGNFNRRVRSLRFLLADFFAWLVQNEDAEFFTLDTTAVPVVKLARATRRKTFRGDQEIAAGRGYDVISKSFYWGYKLVLVNTLENIPVCAGLVPADVDDREAAAWLLAKGAPGWYLADKGFRSRALQESLAQRGKKLLAIPRRNEREKWPQSLRVLVGRTRRRIETAISILKGCYRLAEHGARTFSGLFTRVLAKVIALALRRLYNLAL